jgi:single-strand DNA-binding protein
MITTTAVGRVGKDAQTRYTQGGKPFLTFPLAVDVGWGDNKQTLWFDVAYFSNGAEKLAQHTTKGSSVAVTGTPGTREHEGKTYLTLKASDLSLVGGKGQDKPQASKPAPPVNDFDSDDIPFN